KDVEQTIFFSLDKWCIHGNVASRNFHGVDHLGGSDIKYFSKFFRGRLAFILLFEFGESLRDLVQGADPVEGKADNARLLGECLENRLSNPPHGVGYELETPGFVKALGGLDQTEVSFIDKITERKTLILVLFRDGDNKAKVGFCQLLQRDLISLLYPFCQLDFFVGRQQINLSNFLQVLI